LVSAGHALAHRAHEEHRRVTPPAPPLILNDLRAQKLLSSGVVEGLNNKAKVTMSFYHSLGKLPKPKSTHDFF